MMWILLIPAVAALVFLYIGFAQPRRIVRRLDARHDDVSYRFDTPRRAVALTIDDAPTAAHSAAILDALKRHDAHATFFILGRHAEDHPALVGRVHDEGHEPGNHFYSDRPTVLLGEDTLERHLVATGEAIRRAVGAEDGRAREDSAGDDGTDGGANDSRSGSAVRWCRPGFGWYNARVLRVVRRHGYRLALGSVYPHDTKLRSESLIATIILRRVRPGDIIVLHDRPYTAGVLERILPELSRRGYDVVTLTDLAGE